MGPFLALAGILAALGLGALAAPEVLLGLSAVFLIGGGMYLVSSAGVMPRIKSALGAGWKFLNGAINALWAKGVYDTYNEEGPQRAGEELVWGVAPGAIVGKAARASKLSKFVDDLAKARLNSVVKFFNGDARLAERYVSNVAADVKLNQGRVLSREEALAEASSRISKSKWFVEKDGRLYVMESGGFDPIAKQGKGWTKIWERRKEQFASMDLKSEEEAQRFLLQKFKESKLYVHTDGKTSLLKDGKKTAYYYAEINPPIKGYRYTIFAVNPETGQFITNINAANLNGILNQPW